MAENGGMRNKGNHGRWTTKNFYINQIMAAAQVAKKLKEKRQKRTIEGIFRKVNFGNGEI